MQGLTGFSELPLYFTLSLFLKKRKGHTFQKELQKDNKVRSWTSLTPHVTGQSAIERWAGFAVTTAPGYAQYGWAVENIVRP